MIDLKTTLHRFNNAQHQIWWLLGLALGLRLFHLGAWSFWEDEALTLLLAGQPVSTLLAIITAADVHPPLYFLLVKAFMGLGQSEFIIRLPSALCSTGAVLTLYLIGRDLFDEQVGLMAAFLMTISPLQLFYAQEARVYAPLLLFTGLASWAFIRALHSPSSQWWGLFVVGATLAGYTAYFAFPVFLAMGLYLLLVDRSWAHIWRFGLSAGVVAGLYLPWLGVLFFQAQSVLASFWIESPHPLILLTSLSGFFVGISLPAFWIAVSLAVTLMIIFVILNNVRHALAVPGYPSQALIWLLLWAFVPLLGIYLVSLVRPIFQLRTVITAALPIYLLVSWGLICPPRKRLNQWLFLPTLVVMFIALFNFYFNPAYAKPAWREAAAYVREHAQPNDIGIHTSDGSFLPFLAYDPNIEHVRLLDDPATTQINSRPQAIITAITSSRQSVEAATRGRQRAWLVMGLDRAVEYQLSQKEYFDRHYFLLNQAEVGAVYIFEYALDKKAH